MLVQILVSMILASALFAPMTPLDPSFNITLFKSDTPQGGTGQSLTLSYNQQVGKFVAYDENHNSVTINPTFRSFASIDIPDGNPLWSQASYAQGTIQGDPLQLWAYPASHGTLLEIGAITSSGFYDVNLQTVGGWPNDFWNDVVKEIRVPIRNCRQVYAPLVNR